MNREIKVGEVYKHFKGNTYEIMALAINADNREDVVVYKALYGTGKVFVRSYAEFVSEVDHIKYPDITQKYRFQLVDPEELDVDTMQPSTPQPAKPASPAPTPQPARPSYVPEPVVFANDNSDVNPQLLAFLETRSFDEKLQILRRMESEMTDKLLDDMAASLDVVIPDGDMSTRIAALKTCLATFDKFDCSDRLH